MTNPQQSCDERIANRITENMATASPSATKAMILEALQAKQKTIEEITGKLHTAHDLENKLCALLINHAGETGQSEGAVEVLERKLRELESLRAEVANLGLNKTATELGLMKELSRLREALEKKDEAVTKARSEVCHVMDLILEYGMSGGYLSEKTTEAIGLINEALSITPKESPQ